jgi:hypothetical protein
MGGRGQFAHVFSGDVYDFYSVSPEYFGYTLIFGFTYSCILICIQKENLSDKQGPQTFAMTSRWISAFE